VQSTGFSKQTIDHEVLVFIKVIIVKYNFRFFIKLPIKKLGKNIEKIGEKA